MSILIKGMEMPTDGCHHIICIYADGTVAAGGREYRAVPVPKPHGDLIDRKVLLDGEGRYLISLCKEGIDVEEILRAKTVIPASEEE